MYWHVLRWARDVCFNPSKNTKADYKYGDFIKRLMITSLVTGILGTIIAIISFSALGVNESLVSIFVTIPAFLLTAVISPFIGAAISHFFGKIVFRLMDKEYKKTYNAYAYLEIPNFLFGWIPVIGSLIGGIWGIIVGVYALSNQQKISKGRALLVILIPVIIIVAIIIALAAAAFSYITSSLTPFSDLYEIPA